MAIYGGKIRAIFWQNKLCYISSQIKFCRGNIRIKTFVLNDGIRCLPMVLDAASKSDQQVWLVLNSVTYTDGCRTSFCVGDDSYFD